MGSAEKRNVGRARDEFISGVNYLEVIGGGLFRVTFYVNVTDDMGLLECKTADFAVVMPLTALPDAIGKALAVTGKTVFAREGSLTVMQ